MYSNITYFNTNGKISQPCWWCNERVSCQEWYAACHKSCTSSVLRQQWQLSRRYIFNVFSKFVGKVSQEFQLYHNNNNNKNMFYLSHDMVQNRKYKIKHVAMSSQQIPSCPIIHVQQWFTLLHSTLPRTSWLSSWFLPRIPGSTRKFLGEPVNKALNSWLTKNFKKFLKPGT